MIHRRTHCNKVDLDPITTALICRLQHQCIRSRKMQMVQRCSNLARPQDYDNVQHLMRTVMSTSGTEEMQPTASQICATHAEGFCHPDVGSERRPVRNTATS